MTVTQCSSSVTSDPPKEVGGEEKVEGEQTNGFSLDDSSFDFGRVDTMDFSMNNQTPKENQLQSTPFFNFNENQKFRPDDFDCFHGSRHNFDEKEENQAQRNEIQAMEFQPMAPPQNSDPSLNGNSENSAPLFNFFSDFDVFDF